MATVPGNFIVETPAPKGLGFDGVQFRLDGRDFARVERMFFVAPEIIGVYMRDVFGQFGGSFRRQLLAGATPGMRRLARQSIFYQLRPKQKKQRGVAKQALTGFEFKTQPRMDLISLRIYSTSPVTLLHETGGTIRARDGGAMALPARGRKSAKPGPAKFWNQRGKARRERLPAAQTNNGAKFVRLGAILYKTEKGTRGRTYEPTHILVRQVQIKPALGVLRTWNSLAGDRTRRMQKAIDGAAQAMVKQLGQKVGNVLAGGLRAVS